MSRNLKLSDLQSIAAASYARFLQRTGQSFTPAVTPVPVSRYWFDVATAVSSRTVSSHALLGTNSLLHLVSSPSWPAAFSQISSAAYDPPSLYNLAPSNFIHYDADYLRPSGGADNLDWADVSNALAKIAARDTFLIGGSTAASDGFSLAVSVTSSALLQYAARTTNGGPRVSSGSASVSAADFNYGTVSVSYSDYYGASQSEFISTGGVFDAETTVQSLGNNINLSEYTVRTSEISDLTATTTAPFQLASLRLFNPVSITGTKSGASSESTEHYFLPLDCTLISTSGNTQTWSVPFSSIQSLALRDFAVSRGFSAPSLSSAALRLLVFADNISSHFQATLA